MVSGGDTVKLHIKNQLPATIEFCCGMSEYTLAPEEAVTIMVNDEDCMYFDTLRTKE